MVNAKKLRGIIAENGKTQAEYDWDNSKDILQQNAEGRFWKRRNSDYDRQAEHFKSDGYFFC